MKRIAFAVVAALIFGTAAAQGVARSYKAPPYDIFCSSWRNTVLANGGAICGLKLPPDRGFTITAGSFMIAAISGGGAGNTVASFTDGTNTCTLTMACTATQSLGGQRPVAAGTCTFPAGASVNGTVSTAGCTTTQPSIVNAVIQGRWN